MRHTRPPRVAARNRAAPSHLVGAAPVIRTLFRRRAASPVVAPRPNRKGATLRVEALEDRAVPTAVTAAGLRFAVGVVDSAGASQVRVYDGGGAKLGDVNVSDLAGTGRPTLAT